MSSPKKRSIEAAGAVTTAVWAAASSNSRRDPIVGEEVTELTLRKTL